MSVDPTLLQMALARCDVQGRCDCGRAAGHVGWLVCVQRIVREMRLWA